MALLAAECALKAALMHGFQLNTTSEASEENQNRWFRGKAGHKLQLLWNDQPARLRAMTSKKHDNAIAILSQADPYAYRYGMKKPKREHAEPFVEHSEILVEWTQCVMGVTP